MMSNQEDYDVKIEEVHHTEKKDFPSGTAITLAKQIISEVNQKTEYKGRLIFNENLPAQSVKDHEILIESIRVGDVTGDHKVIYESIIDEIQITHKAKSRYGFAKGAILAAEWIQDKKGLYTMEDILNL